MNAQEPNTIAYFKSKVEGLLNKDGHSLEELITISEAAKDCIGTAQSLESLGYAELEQRYAEGIQLARSLSLLYVLIGWYKQPRNVFKDIHLGEYTLLGLLSPLALVTINTVKVEAQGIMYIQSHGRPGFDGIPEEALFIEPGDGDGVRNKFTDGNLAKNISRFIQKGYKLVRRSQIVFREIKLKEKELMLILSCTEPIIVQNVIGKEGSVFIAGQVSRDTLQWLCDELDVEFDRNELDGVFQTELTQ